MLKIVIISLFIAFAIFISGCARDSFTPSNPTTKGVFVLCEGDFSTPGDYSFINTINDSVANNIYSNSNGSANMGFFPDFIYLYAPYIYIVSQGVYTGPGKMFKIDYTSNKLLDTSQSFGINPYNFELANSNFYVTNTAGSTVTKINLSDLSIAKDGIQVGSNPSKAVYDSRHSIYVAKQSYTSENSVTIIDVNSDLVTKAYFPAPPVSVAFTTDGMFVSDYSNKKLYVMDSITPNRIIDSIVINVPSLAIGEIIPGEAGKLYLVGVDDTSFSSNIGNRVYRFDISTRSIDQGFSTILMSSPHNVYGIAYEPINKILYIADSQSGSINGEVWTFSSSGTYLKTYSLTQKNPVKFAFKYSN